MEYKGYLITILTSTIFSAAIFVIAHQNPIHSILMLILVFALGTFLLLILKLEYYGLLFLIVYVGAIVVLFLFIVMMLDIKISRFSFATEPLRWAVTVWFLNLILSVFIYTGAEYWSVLNLRNNTDYVNFVLAQTQQHLNGIASESDIALRIQNRVLELKNTLNSDNSFLANHWQFIVNGDYKKVPTFFMTETNYKDDIAKLLLEVSNIKLIGLVFFRHSRLSVFLGATLLTVAMIGALALAIGTGEKKDIKDQDANQQFQKDSRNSIYFVRINNK